MSKYRIEVEAFEWTGDPHILKGIPWAYKALNEEILYPLAREEFPKLALFIKTLEGTMRANPGDYIIQGVKGEIYPCKPDIFLSTYKPVITYSMTEATVSPKMDPKINDQGNFHTDSKGDPECQ